MKIKLKGEGPISSYRPPLPPVEGMKLRPGGHVRAWNWKKIGLGAVSVRRRNPFMRGRNQNQTTFI